MAWTTDDVVKLERAIAKGTTRVTLGDRTVQYADIDAMRRARREMLDELATDTTRRKRVIRLTQTGTGY